MKKCVIYSRVSTQDQNFQSQLEDLTKYATYHDFEVIESFGEKVSGYDLSKERFEYDKMKQYVLDNNIKDILIWELSRFSRSTAKALTEIEFFTQNGINIYFKKENLSTLSDAATNKLLLSMLSAIAELERSTIVERSIRGRLSAAAKGKNAGYAMLPLGYKTDKNGYLQIDDKDAKIIHLIFDMAEEGTPINAIKTHLNSIGVPTWKTRTGKKRIIKNGNELKEVKSLWSHSTVANMLKNPIYKGKRIFSGQTFEVPAIISEEQWDKVQQRFEKKVGYVNRTKYEYLLKGKVICGKCGKTYQSRTDLASYYDKRISRRGKVKSSYYYCSGRHDSSIKCDNGATSSKALDKSVFDLILRHSEIMVSIHNRNMANFPVQEKKDQIAFYELEIDRVNKKQERVISLYKEGLIDEEQFRKDLADIKRELKDINKEIQKTEKEIQNFNDYEIRDIDSFKSLATETNFDIKREFINKYVEKVEVYKVLKHNLDFEKLVYWETGVDSDKPKRVKYNDLQKGEKITYYELFAFGSDDPVKAVVSSRSKNSYSSDKLEFNTGTLTLMK